MHCEHLGCKLYYPQVIVGFNKNRVLKRAEEKWNNSVDELEEKL